MIWTYKFCLEVAGSYNVAVGVWLQFECNLIASNKRVRLLCDIEFGGE